MNGARAPSKQKKQRATKSPHKKVSKRSLSTKAKSTTTSATPKLSQQSTTLSNIIATCNKDTTTTPHHTSKRNAATFRLPAPKPNPNERGSFNYHVADARNHNFKVGTNQRLTNIVRGSWSQRPAISYNIVEHMGREPNEVDAIPDGGRVLTEPSQFTPQDFREVPTVDELSPKRKEYWLHHNELARMRGAFIAAPATGKAEQDPMNRWMNNFRNYIWQPEVQSYQTQVSRARLRLIDHDGLSHGKGGRKSSTAFATLKPGTGLMFVNSRPYTQYFENADHRSQMGLPFYMTGTVSQFDVMVNVKGGGTNAQSEACKLAIANALQNFEPQLRPTLKVNGLLKRDQRHVERKHAGRKKARKSFAWVKR